MTSSTQTYIHCIHGMIWQTCNACREKTEENVLSELNLQKEEQKSKLIYDYQEQVSGSDLEDTDLAYDMEDSGGM